MCNLKKTVNKLLKIAAQLPFIHVASSPNAQTNSSHGRIIAIHAEDVLLKIQE